MFSPVYFPFTWIHEKMLLPFEICFGTVHLYMASNVSISNTMTHLQKNNKIIYHDLPKDYSHEKKLKSILDAYYSWGHTLDSQMKHVHEQQKAHDESSAQFIRDQIKSYNSDNPKDLKDKHDHILHAQIWLHMAQNYDLNQWDVNSVLDAHQKKLSQLFAEDPLPITQTMTDSLSLDELLSMEDRGNLHPDMRLHHWSILYALNPVDHPLFITDSQGIMDIIKEKFSSLLLITQGNIPSHRNDNQIQACIHQFMNSDAQIDQNIDSFKTGWQALQNNTNHSSIGSITFYYIPNCSVFHFLSEFTEFQQDTINATLNQPAFIAFIDHSNRTIVS